MDKNKLKQELKAKLKQEMSTTGTGASVTPGVGAGVATKYAFAKKKDGNKIAKDYIKTFGGKLAPSIPNRPSKAMDYKELWEDFKVGDKVTYLGHPGEITAVNKEMSGAITYNVSYDKGNGKTKASNIYNKDGEIKPLKEDNSTDEILTYLQAAKQNGTLSPDAQEVFLQWMNTPGASREEIIKVLRNLTGVYLNEGLSRDEIRPLTAGLPYRIESGEDYDKIMITEPLPKDVKDRAIKRFIDAGWEAKPNNTGGITAIKKAMMYEGYAQFRNSTKTRTKPEQFHQAVKEVKKKVNEINRLFEYMDRLKSELNEGEELKYKKYTERSIQQIKESTKQLFFKSTKLK
jgi:hypothetical protein